MSCLPPPARHRALFLSDLHLGAPGAQPERVLAFLEANRAQHYYLVGDILDLWHPALPLWNAACQAVIDHLAARAAAGADVTYIAGNHDPDLIDLPLNVRPPAAPQRRVVHQTAQGRKFLVIHGDQADNRLLRFHFMTRLGSRLDLGLRRLERRLRGSQRGVERLREMVNRALYRARSHERRLLALAQKEGLEGVICGHFHIPALHDDFGLTYANCGDFVDTFSALAEAHDGALTLLEPLAAHDPQPEWSLA